VGEFVVETTAITIAGAVLYFWRRVYEITVIDEESLTDGFALTGMLFGVAAK
jgi:hypothetical protein